MNKTQTKATLRRQLLKARRNLSTGTVKSMSDLITERLITSSSFISARSIALYADHDMEVKTEALLLRALELQKEVYYPALCEESLSFYRVRAASELVSGPYGILAPDTNKVCTVSPATELDMVVLPGVAFDEAGTRIGFGKGYYDRALPGLRADIIVALAYEFQVVSGWIPTEKHDMPVSMIVTEKRVIDLSGNRSKM